MSINGKFGEKNEIYLFHFASIGVPYSELDSIMKQSRVLA